MESNHLGYFPPRRRRSIIKAAVWPWQTGPTVPRRPPRSYSSADSSQSPTPSRTPPVAKPSAALAPLSGTDYATASGDAGYRRGNAAQELGSRALVGPANTLRSAATAIDEVACSELVPSDGVPDDWPYITSHEKRRMWVRRRDRGHFFFRTEFKGLVYQVMQSRGWKPACSPRVSDEEPAGLSLETWDERGIETEPASNFDDHEEDSHYTQSPLAENKCFIDGTAAVPERSNMTTNDTMFKRESRAAAQGADLDRLIVGEFSGRRQWDVHWSYTKWAVETMRFARKLAPWQKVNHFRNSKELCRKDLMLKNLKKRRALLTSQGELTEANAYNFVPVSFELPKDYALFVEEFRGTGGTWIMKPSGSAEGKGIFLFSKLSDVKAWAKPHLLRGLRRSDPANPGSYVVQRYVSNPLLLGGKKFDLRLYVLVTSFRPLTAYIYRDGFAKFSSTRFSADAAHLKDELMHLTNHAVQRRGAASGKKWNLKKFKLYVAMQHGQKAMDKLFWEIQALMLRTLRAVARLIINDKQSFELFGYDVMVDENLRPWLLEVNASPSLGASNREDLHLKKQMMHDLFDTVDVEGRLPKNGAVREHVGGFYLAYHNGYVELLPSQCGHSTLLGAAIKNSARYRRRSKSEKVLVTASKDMEEERTALENDSFVLSSSGVADDVWSTSWRPNILMFVPEDRWKGMVDYYDLEASTVTQSNKSARAYKGTRCNRPNPIVRSAQIFEAKGQRSFFDSAEVKLERQLLPLIEGESNNAENATALGDGREGTGAPLTATSRIDRSEGVPVETVRCSLPPNRDRYCRRVTAGVVQNSRHQEENSASLLSGRMINVSGAAAVQCEKSPLAGDNQRDGSDIQVVENGAGIVGSEQKGLVGSGIASFESVRVETVLTVLLDDLRQVRNARLREL